MRAGGYRSYFGGGSDCLNVLDHRTGERRRPTLNDVREASTLLDALPEIDFVMSAFLPEDVDPRIYDRYQMEVMLNNTTKPIVFVTPDFEGCMAAVEMCEIVAGGTEAFQQRPFATCYINVTSGLTANAEALQKCMYLAEKGLPQLYIPLNAGGVNSPVTTAGCMASMNAGILLGIVLSQLVREGAAVAVPGWNGGPYNLQTMVGNYVLADEQGVPTSMGKYYDLPVFGLGGSTDSKVLDQQSGFEVTFSSDDRPAARRQYRPRRRFHGCGSARLAADDGHLQRNPGLPARRYGRRRRERRDPGAGCDRGAGTDGQLPGARAHPAPLQRAVLFQADR